ncbi:MAG: hypothetical protein ACOCXP_03060 [Candidatus Dojkabacteria bacterium]
MLDRSKKLVDELLGDGLQGIKSSYIPLDKADHEKNQKMILSALKEAGVDDSEFIKFAKVLEEPHINRTVALFTKDNSLVASSTLPFEYQVVLEGKRAFTLPFSDYRYEFYAQTYVLTVSEDILELFKLSSDSLEQVYLAEGKTFQESVLVFREERKSLQHHYAEGNQLHGQGASNKDELENLKENYLKDVAQMLVTQFGSSGEEVEFIVAAPSKTASIVRNNLPDKYLSLVQINGSYAGANEFELLTQIEEKLKSAEMSLPQDTDELAGKSFTEILSVVEDGRVSRLVVGKLGENLADFDNPIAPQGANYISQEVLKFGGEVVYYPELEIEASETNLLFELRY